MLSSSCRIDASAACSGGLSPGCWFLSAALPDPVLRSGLSRPRDGLGAKRDSAGFAAGVGVWLGCCSGGISITNSAFVDRAGWEALAEGIFVTACPRCGGKGGMLPTGLAGLLTCGVDGRHIVRRTHGVASLDCSAGVAGGRATRRSTRQRAPRGHADTVWRTCRHQRSGQIQCELLSVQSKCSGVPWHSWPPCVACVVVVSDSKMPSGRRSGTLQLRNDHSPTEYVIRCADEMCLLLGVSASTRRQRRARSDDHT